MVSMDSLPIRIGMRRFRVGMSVAAFGLWIPFSAAPAQTLEGAAAPPAPGGVAAPGTVRKIASSGRPLVVAWPSNAQAVDTDSKFVPKTVRSVRSAGAEHFHPNAPDPERTSPPSGRITLDVSRGRTLRLARPANTIFIADPSIADVQTPSNQVVFLFGKKSGRTSLFALDENGEAIAQYAVAVTQPIEDLRSLLQSEVGDYKVNAVYTPSGGVVLSGNLPNAGLVETAKAIAQNFLGSGGIVTNQIRISGALQVNLQVRVAEVRRTVLKRFGVNLNANAGAGGFGFALNSGGRSTGTSTPQQTTRGGGQVGFSYSDGINSISASLDALAEEGLATILAEPNLTAISGEKASFLAGGEFPVPLAQALGQTSVQFRRFGASLEFQPTVLSSKLINIRVRPEVSELSIANGVSLNGLSIPGLNTRSAETVVELASGQSFVIGGLIRKNFSTDIGVLPGLGDIPILGALFRSSDFQQDQSELIIIVTPYIVRPSSDPQALGVPSDRVAPPTDTGRVLLNTLSKAPSARLAPRRGSVGLTGEAGLGAERAW